MDALVSAANFKIRYLTESVRTPKATQEVKKLNESVKALIRSGGML
jgi:hypothetical protein